MGKLVSLMLNKLLTDCDIMRSRTSWEVVEEAKEKGFPEIASGSSDSPTRSSWTGMAAEQAALE